MESTTDERPWFLISKMRDDSHRPLIRSMADVLEKIGSEQIELLGELRGRCHGPGVLAGHYGGLCRVEGETDAKRFAIAIPFADQFEGVDENGERHTQDIGSFENVIIRPDGAVQMLPGIWLKRVTFGIVRLPYRWSQTNATLTRLFSEYANKAGLSKAALGRDLPTTYPDYYGLAQIRIDRLDRIAGFVADYWNQASSDPLPSRGTIASTLATLSMRNRVRGPHSMRDKISP